MAAETAGLKMIRDKNGKNRHPLTGNLARLRTEVLERGLQMGFMKKHVVLYGATNERVRKTDKKKPFQVRAK